LHQQPYPRYHSLGLRLSLVQTDQQTSMFDSAMRTSPRAPKTCMSGQLCRLMLSNGAAKVPASKDDRKTCESML
jgi:hypothetical protein